LIKQQQQQQTIKQTMDSPPSLRQIVGAGIQPCPEHPATQRATPHTVQLVGRQQRTPDLTLRHFPVKASQPAHAIWFMDRLSPRRCLTWGATVGVSWFATSRCWRSCHCPISGFHKIITSAETSSAAELFVEYVPITYASSFQNQWFAFWANSSDTTTTTATTATTADSSFSFSLSPSAEI
jgi:hypothetical protein